VAENFPDLFEIGQAITNNL